MLDAAALEPLGVKESLHCVEFSHAVADGRAGGESKAMAGVLPVQVAGLHEEVKGPLAAAGLNTGNSVHLGRRLQVLKVLRLVDKQAVHGKLVEDQPVVLFLQSGQLSKPLLTGCLLLLDGLDDVPPGTCGIRTRA